MHIRRPHERRSRMNASHFLARDRTHKLGLFALCMYCRTDILDKVRGSGDAKISVSLLGRVGLL